MMKSHSLLLMHDKTHRNWEVKVDEYIARGYAEYTQGKSAPALPQLRTAFDSINKVGNVLIDTFFGGADAVTKTTDLDKFYEAMLRADVNEMANVLPAMQGVAPAQVAQSVADRQQERKVSAAQGEVDRLANVVRGMEAEIKADRLSKHSPFVMQARERLARAEKALADVKGAGEGNYSLAEDVSGSLDAENINDRYSLLGKRSDGIEVYVLDRTVRNLTKAQKAEELERMIGEEYRGRTARFVRDGKTYYARFFDRDISKIVDTRSGTNSSNAAKFCVGASGDMFDLVENSRFRKTEKESGKNTRNHAGVTDWDYFIKTVQIEDAVYDVHIDIRRAGRENGENQFVYNVRLNYNKKIKPISASSSARLRGVTVPNVSKGVHASTVLTWDMLSNLLNPRNTVANIRYNKDATVEDLLSLRGHGIQATRVDDSEILSHGMTYTESFGNGKSYETRPTRRSIPLNQWVPIQSTHSADQSRNNKIVGFAWFDSVKEYDRDTFHEPRQQNEHLVPVGSKADADSQWVDGKKYGFHIGRYVPIDPIDPSTPAEGMSKSRYSLAPSGTQKSANTAYPSAAEDIRALGEDETRYSFKDEAKAMILKKRPDLWMDFATKGRMQEWEESTGKTWHDNTDEGIAHFNGVVADRAVSEMMKFPDSKARKAALNWFIKGAIRLPEDAPKVTQALEYAVRAKGKANTDALSYDSPMTMMDALHEFKPKAKPINPDTVPELSDKREMGNGVVTYLVQDDRAGQEAMRKILNTHWGEDANSWCLLHGDGHGNLCRSENAMTGQVITGFAIMDAMKTRMRMFWTMRMLVAVSGMMLVGTAVAEMPQREDVAHVTIERPKMPWLFGGFGFQNAEAQLTPLMTEAFRNERAVKSFRELSPSFSRVYVGRVGESKEALDRFADYYDQTFRPCDTTIYAVGGSMPAFPDKLDVQAHAEGVAKSLEYLIKVRDCRKIRYYCLTNELMCDDQWGFFKYKNQMPLFKEYHQALYDAFRRHGLDIQLAASDGSYGRKQAEELKWTVENMDLITGIYCTHYYDGKVKPGDLSAYSVFEEQFTNIVQLALGRTKRWMLGEFGIVPPRERGVMVDDRNWNGYDASRAGVAAVTMAEMAMAAINSGAYAVMSWSFCDYPDPFVIEDSHDPIGHARYESAKAVYKPDMKYNKWGVFRWSDVQEDFGPNPTYITLGLISRYFRKDAYVLSAKTEDPFIRMCVLENRDGTKTLALVNLGPKRTVSVAGWGVCPRNPRFYLYDSARPRLNAFGDLPAPDGTLTPVDGTFALEIPEKGMAFVTTDYQNHTSSAVKDVKVEKGRLTWTAVDDPHHCYYRVYANGRQIASTVATSRDIADDTVKYTVVSVDRWGNAGVRAD